MHYNSTLQNISSVPLDMWSVLAVSVWLQGSSVMERSIVREVPTSRTAVCMIDYYGDNFSFYIKYNYSWCCFFLTLPVARDLRAADQKLNSPFCRVLFCRVYELVTFYCFALFYLSKDNHVMECHNAFDKNDMLHVS